MPERHSGGPTSTEGKDRSSQNATKHGLCSNRLILPDEDEQEFLAMRQGWLDRLRLPVCSHNYEILSANNGTRDTPD
jgi:hypothetical protein